MTPSQKALLSFLSLLACSVGALAFWLWQGQWDQPLGPVLRIPTVTPYEMPATWTPDPDALATLRALPTTAPILQASPLPTFTPQLGLCGAPPVMNILAIGADTRGDNYNYGLADVIRLVRVDSVTPKITVLEFPRDLWVEIPDIADNLKGQDHEKLNQAYLYGNRGFGYTDDPAQGPGLLARTLNLNFGVRPDHYLAVNMRTFESVVDAIGGLDIYLPYEISVRSNDNPKGFAIPEGQHHIDGETALWIARIRQYHTFGRAENQNIVMCALRKKLLSPEVIPAIPELVRSFRSYVQTDFSPEQINQLACLATQTSGTNVVFASFPMEIFKGARMYDPQLKATTSVLDADFDVLRDYIDRFQQGTWPDPDLVIQNTPSPAATDLEFSCED